MDQDDSALGAHPVVWAPSLAPPLRATCATDCGLSRTQDAKRCGRACQFIKPDYPAMESRVHGRPRDPSRPDEIFFGPFRRMARAALAAPKRGAQWTGITTRIASACSKPAPSKPSSPWPPIPPTAGNRCPSSSRRRRNVPGPRHAYGLRPVARLLEPVRDRGFKRIAVIGIPCQVFALRSIEKELGLDRLYVIGTPCSDNTTTENFHTFLELLADDPRTITYLEFRADYYVELRFTDGSKKEIPFLKLPISKLPSDFFPLTCRTCVDYTMFSLTSRRLHGRRGRAMAPDPQRSRRRTLEIAWQRSPPLRTGQRGASAKSAVAGFLANTERAGRWPAAALDAGLARPSSAGDAEDRPRGLEFARSRLEMKAWRDGGPSAPRHAAPCSPHGSGPRLGPRRALWIKAGAR